MINKLNINFWLLFTMLATVISCNAQKDTSKSKTYEPYPEHQYYIELDNDSLLLHLFSTVMSVNDIINSQNGKVFMEIELNTEGQIINVAFERIDNFILSEDTKETLVLEIKKQIKFNVTEDAKNYYRILGNPIKINLVVSGQSLMKK